MIGLTVYLTLGITVIYLIFFRRKARYPPGPTPLPLIGNLLALGKDPHLTVSNFFPKYGPIVSMEMGPYSVVLLHGAKLIKEAFNDPRFSGRPIGQDAAEQFFTGGPAGIALSQGSLWADQRRFALRHLRDFGFGKTSMEGMIMNEVKELVDWLKHKNGEPVTLHRRFTLAIINALWTIISGERYDHDDAKLTEILDQFEAIQHVMLNFGAKSLLVMFFPGLAQKFPNISGWNYLRETVAPRRKLVRRAIEEHQRTIQYDSHPRDFIDAYLQNIKATEDPDSSFYGEEAIKSLQAVLDDFFFAGTDTSSTTLSWAMLYLLHNPEVQKKLHAEIDAVVGKTRLPSLADRNSMPYTQAFIMEVTRKSSILSSGVPHATLEDVEFHGYVLPKNTMIMASLYSTHHDPEIWGDPENFRPERFLSDDETKVQPNESLLAFSTGKRACLGETFAKNQLFLFITTILQHFDVIPEPGKDKPSLAVKQGTSLQPYPYFLVMKERL